MDIHSPPKRTGIDLFPYPLVPRDLVIWADDNKKNGQYMSVYVYINYIAPFIAKDQNIYIYIYICIHMHENTHTILYIYIYLYI